MQRLIILRGAPSSGKSTIAKKLRNYQSKIVWLKVDSFKDFFGEENPKALDDVNQLAIYCFSYLLDHNFSPIMEGIFQNPEFIQKAVRVAKNKKIPVKVYELECSLQTLLKRDLQREGVKKGCRKPLGEEVITKLYKIVEERPFKEAIKLNTEKLTIKECIKIISKN